MLDEKLNSYIDYWEIQDEVKVEPFFGTLFSWFRDSIDWDGKAGIFIKNIKDTKNNLNYLSQNITSQEIDDIDTDEYKNRNLHNAFNIELRQRIYEKIYKGNIFDQLMPIESKSYLSSKHLLKFTFIFSFLLAILVGSMYFFSTMYHVDNNKDSILKTYEGYYAPYINKLEYFNDISKIIANELNNTKVVNDEYNKVRNTNYKITRLMHDVKKIRLLFENQVIAKIENQLVQDRKELDKDYFNNFLNYAIFFTILQKENLLLKQYIYEKKIIMTPFNNKYENFSQVALFVIGSILLIFFFNMKSDFLSLISKLENYKNKIEIITAFEILMDKHFTHRKKFHYFMAFAVSTIFVLLHNVGIQEYSHFIGKISASILGVSQYDYRINISAIAIFYLYWVTQIFLLYFVVLTGWEVRQLILIKKLLLVKINKDDNE